MAEGWEVYILQMKDGTYYTGIAKDAEKRLKVHNSGKGAKYTRARLPAVLVYRENSSDYSAALKREAAIKKLTRADKENLIHHITGKKESIRGLIMENEVLKTIWERKSVRSFTDKEIPEEAVHEILKAGMAGPTARNTRCWEFLVMRDPELLKKVADANGENARPLKSANLGILLCVNWDKAIQHAPDYCIIDGAIAGQNMILAAESMGIGSVWLGTWPVEQKMQADKDVFNLPENICPHSLIAFGYPDKEGGFNYDKPEFVDEIVHYERW